MKYLFLLCSCLMFKSVGLCQSAKYCTVFKKKSWIEFLNTSPNALICDTPINLQVPDFNDLKMIFKASDTTIIKKIMKQGTQSLLPGEAIKKCMSVKNRIITLTDFDTLNIGFYKSNEENQLLILMDSLEEKAATAGESGEYKNSRKLYAKVDSLTRTKTYIKYKNRMEVSQKVLFIFYPVYHYGNYILSIVGYYAREQQHFSYNLIEQY